MTTKQTGRSRRKERHMQKAMTQKQHGQATVSGEQPSTNIIEVLTSLRKGTAILDLQSGLQELVAAVRDTKRKGKITLELSVECRTAGSAKSVEVTDEIKVVPPKPIKPKTTMFTTDKNTLHREDPAQGTLDGIIDEE